MPEANAEWGNGQPSNPEADANADISKMKKRRVQLPTRTPALTGSLRNSVYLKKTSVVIKTLRNEVGRLEELSGKQGKELVDMSQRLAIVEAKKSELRSASDSVTDRRRRVTFYGSSSKRESEKKKISVLNCPGGGGGMFALHVGICYCFLPNR